MSCGATLTEAKRLTYSQAAWIVGCRYPDTGGARGGVREATQADIKKLLG